MSTYHRIGEKPRLARSGRIPWTSVTNGPDSFLCCREPYSGWQTARMLEFKELRKFLLARAMEHDAPSLLSGWRRTSRRSTTRWKFVWACGFDREWWGEVFQ